MIDILPIFTSVIESYLIGNGHLTMSETRTAYEHFKLEVF